MCPIFFIPVLTDGSPRSNVFLKTQHCTSGLQETAGAKEPTEYSSQIEVISVRYLRILLNTI